MKIYGRQNVFDAALDRIRYLYREFPEVVCCWSGGKDSTVCLHLCLEVARELGRLPLRVAWLDQEVEWQGTVDLAEKVMTRPDVKPMWFQMPMVITNNASSYERFNYCWRESDRAKWAHPQHPLSTKVNRYGTVRFHELFGAIWRVEFPDTPVCAIGGMRTQETPKRALCLTERAPCYKWITWGKPTDRRRGHFTFYPIFDWDVQDVWKAIHAHGWEYNRVYDGMYRYGVAVRDMRISNLHHETAIQNLLLVQEIEPETWVRVADRICGANTVKHLRRKAFSCPEELPFMFPTWDAYMEHLIENIIQDGANRAALRSHIASAARGLPAYPDEPIRSKFIHAVVNSILASDWDWTKLANFASQPETCGYRRWRQWLVGKRPPHESWLTNRFIPETAKPAIREALKGAVRT